MSRNKVIIIGGGLGGLMSGALLAKEGYDVSVFEKHHIIGGGLQSYKRFGATFDTCMHVFGGMREGGNIRRICEYLGIMDSFEYLDIDNAPCLSVFVDSDHSEYAISNGREGFVDSLSAYFPEEKENLVKYVSSIYNIMEELDLFHLRHTRHNIFEHSDEYNIPVNELLDGCFNSERLKSIVSCFNTLYAGEKDISPAFLHSAISMIFLKGACRIVGGYSKFAEALVGAIKENKGEVRTGCEVKAINTVDGKFSSVVLASGEVIAADYCISSIPPTCMLKLIDNPCLFSKAYRESLEERNDSLSAFIINIKLKDHMLKFFNNIRFFFSDYDSSWKVSDGSSINKFMYMTPPEEGQGEWASTLSITAVMDWKAVERWENSMSGARDGSYYAWKEKLCKDVLEKMNAVIPGFSDMVDSVDSASPLTIRDYTSVRHGAMCGYRNEGTNLFNSFLPIKTKVTNLLLTGQSVNLHGFCGVSLTAIQTAETILGDNFITDKL